MSYRAYILMAYIAMANIVTDYVVMVYIAMACLVMAYMVMACVVMAYIVMATMGARAWSSICRTKDWSLYSYGLCIVMACI